MLAGRAATPDATATLVVFNNALPISADLAGYYAEKRGIPFDHLIGLDCPTAETIERADYDRTIATPLRNAFIDRGWWLISTKGSPENLEAATAQDAGALSKISRVVENKIRYVVLMTGVPLRIAQTSNYPGDSPSGPSEVLGCNAAAVDSELACLGYLTKSISGTLNNPYFRSYKSFAEAQIPGLMLVCRLDAPTGQMVRRMIDDSIAAEKTGLWGMTYVDSRGYAQKKSSEPILKGSLEWGDECLNHIAAASRKSGVPVIQDDTPELFPEDYPLSNVAQYYGWYSENIAGAFSRPDFRFVPGAVACHIHSFSATSLRDPHKGWVAPLLAHGAAASMGAVYEPYLSLIPNLDIFEDHLRGGYSFGESAYASLRVVSWMTTVVGDPLYTPFKLLPDSPPPKAAEEWEAYRKGAQTWFNQSRAEGEKQLIQSGRALGSGIIFENLGLLQANAGDAAAALRTFQEARKYYKQEDDIMRTAIHEVELLKGQKKEALGLIKKMVHDHPKAHGVAILLAAQAALSPAPAVKPTDVRR